jgi:hypothetical protein
VGDGYPLGDAANLTVSGAGSTINVQEPAPPPSNTPDWWSASLIVGYDSGPSTLSIANGGKVNNLQVTSIEWAGFPGVSGGVTVDGAGSELFTRELWLGPTTVGGSLAISNGGVVDVTGALYIGYHQTKISLVGGTVETGAGLTISTNAQAPNLRATISGYGKILGSVNLGANGVIGSTSGLTASPNTLDLSAAPITGTGTSSLSATTNSIVDVRALNIPTLNIGGNGVVKMGAEGSATVATVSMSSGPNSGTFQLGNTDSVDFGSVVGSGNLAFAAFDGLTVDDYMKFGTYTQVGGASPQVVYTGPLLESFGGFDNIDLKDFSFAGANITAAPSKTANEYQLRV